MAAPKPTMRRRKPSSAALDFVEEGAKKAKPAQAKNDSGASRKKTSAKRNKPRTVNDEDEKRVAKRLYLPEDVERELRLRSATDGLQQSEIATAALRKYLGL